MDRTPTIRLNNGVEMPALGLGVFRAQGDEVYQSVKAAIESGYRLIDTAAVYNNEEQVGKAVDESGISREEFFITTKLWITDFGYDEALKAFDTSLSKLRLDYIDLYLLHFPAPSNFEATLESWRAMEYLLEQQRVRAIGVCNFKEKHLEILKQRFEVTPALNQVELHPYFSQPELNNYHSQSGIVTQAWSPIGGAFHYHPEERPLPHILAHPLIETLAKKHGKTPAQIVLRWHLQQGRSVIPKSVHPDRIQQNIQVFNFRLSSEDMQTIDHLNANMRVAPDPDIFDMEYVNQ